MSMPSAKTHYPWHQQGEIFRQRREQIGKSQLDVARESGLSNTTISKLERGRQDPNRMEPRTLVALADALDWTVAELSSITGVTVIGNPDSVQNVLHATIDPSVQHINGVIVFMLENFNLEVDEGGAGRLIPTNQRVAFALPSDETEFTAADADAGTLFAVSGNAFNISLGGTTRKARSLVLTQKDLHKPGDFVTFVLGQPVIQELREVPADIEARLARGEVVGRVVSIIL